MEIVRLFNYERPKSHWMFWVVDTQAIVAYFCGCDCVTTMVTMTVFMMVSREFCTVSLIGAWFIVSISIAIWPTGFKSPFHASLACPHNGCSRCGVLRQVRVGLDTLFNNGTFVVGSSIDGMGSAFVVGVTMVAVCAWSIAAQTAVAILCVLGGGEGDGADGGWQNI